jgi:hypothetical protein
VPPEQSYQTRGDILHFDLIDTAPVRPLLVLFVAAGIVSACLDDPLRAAGAAGSTATSARSARVGALRFSYPDRLAHLLLPHGVLVTDYRVSMNSPTVREAVFPATGVLFGLSRELKLQHPIAAPTVRFPLSMVRLGASHSRPNGRTWELRFSVKDAVYLVTVWFGKGSDGRDRAAIASVVSSIRTG